MACSGPFASASVRCRSVAAAGRRGVGGVAAWRVFCPRICPMAVAPGAARVAERQCRRWPGFQILDKSNPLRSAAKASMRCAAGGVMSCPRPFPPVRRGLFGRLKPVVGLRNSAFREPERPVWQGRTARLACLSGASGRIAWRRRMLSCWQTARWLLPSVAPAFAAMGSACCRFAILGRDNRLAAGGAAAADVPAVQCYFA